MVKDDTQAKMSSSKCPTRQESASNRQLEICVGGSGESTTSSSTSCPKTKLPTLPSPSLSSSSSSTTSSSSSIWGALAEAKERQARLRKKLAENNGESSSDYSKSEKSDEYRKSVAKEYRKNAVAYRKMLVQKKKDGTASDHLRVTLSSSSGHRTSFVPSTSTTTTPTTTTTTPCSATPTDNSPSKQKWMKVSTTGPGKHWMKVNDSSSPLSAAKTDEVVKTRTLSPPQQVLSHALNIFVDKNDEDDEDDDNSSINSSIDNFVDAAAADLHLLAATTNKTKNRSRGGGVDAAPTAVTAASASTTSKDSTLSSTSVTEEMSASSSEVMRCTEDSKEVKEMGRENAVPASALTAAVVVQKEEADIPDDASLASCVSELSIQDLMMLRRPPSILKRKDSVRSLNASSLHSHSARFSLESSQIIEVPKFDKEDLPDLFYDDDELANMRHEAFCEKLGINPDDYD
jgi:hypothetical protein